MKEEETINSKMSTKYEKIQPNPKVKNTKTPCLKDLKKFHINRDNMDSNDK